MTAPGEHQVWAGLERRLSAVEALVPDPPPWHSRHDDRSSVDAPVHLGPTLDRRSATRAGGRPFARLGWAVAVVGVLLAIVAGALLAGGMRQLPRPPSISVAFGPTGLLRGSDSTTNVALLPDGRALVVTARTVGFDLVAAPRIWDPEAGLIDTAPSIAPRLNPTATLLLDGRVLVVGGMGGPFAYPDTAVATAETWDPGSGRFATTGSMAHPRVGHTATLLADGRVLVAGGAWPRVDDATAEVWDPATGQFTAAGVMGLGVDNRGLGRSNHSAVLLQDGRVLVAGGMGADGTGRGRSETWDPRTSRFDGAGLDLVDDPADVSLTRLLDGRVLLIARLPGVGATARTWDPVTGVTVPAALEAAGLPETAVLLGDGRVVLFGTSDPSATETTVETWDPDSGEVEDASPLGGSVDAQSFTLLPDGRILVVRAAPGPDPVDAFVYDVARAP